MMDEKSLKRFLINLSGVDDFTLELKQKFSSTYWGRYFAWRKIIRLYALDENGEQYPDDILVREGTHELAHHIQFHHVPGWEPVTGCMHDDMFYDIHKALLDKAFGREVPVKYSPIVESLIASRK